jgi:hypothetical protein
MTISWHIFGYPDSPSWLLPVTIRNSPPFSVSLHVYIQRRTYGCLFMRSLHISKRYSYLYKSFIMVDHFHSVVLYTLIHVRDRN